MLFKLHLSFDNVYTLPWQKISIANSYKRGDVGGRGAEWMPDSCNLYMISHWAAALARGGWGVGPDRWLLIWA